MCEYCRQTKDKFLAGKDFEVHKTNKLRAKNHTDNLYCFVLKSEDDEKAGLMIGTIEGYHYININYCPMCGRKLGD
jgi:hypothetical protein